MTKSAKIFIGYTYLIFWGFILLMGGLMFVTGSKQPSNILQIISSWTPTIVVVIFWKKLRPQANLKGFIKGNFSAPLRARVVAAVVGIHLLLLIGSLVIISSLVNQPIQALLILSPSFLLTAALSHVIRGPIGEELGWRGFLLEELQKKHTPLVASIILGLVWSGWHFPLWLMSGYSGMNLVQYILFFTLWCIAQSIIMTLLYKWNANLLIPMIFHFFSNYFLGLQKGELLMLLKVNASLCLIAAIICGITLYRKTLLEQSKMLSVSSKNSK
ncbi:type II CAAX endopeptidase family protein [Enterococcus sp.]|uniref:CPBP family intramembrane glutamic endopeptidase n=1 Tax=Enterococcus sp. TaxID=35783 RepID=UPI0029093CD5|nr:type II CAAX endopeptidase family protein [Enterococcus sp.]MDU5335137.1 type II CAAX endopeptidase family protein [Enterococcus sp.]